MSKQPLQVGIVGYGHIGKRHAQVVQQNSECELAGVCDLLSAEQVGWQTADTRYTRDISELLKSDLDIVAICTPNGLHAPQAIAALQHGKHVIIEKPMALQSADCEKIIFEAFKQSLQVFCVMQNRYSPVMQWLKKNLLSGQAGSIRFVEVHCFWNRDDRYYRPGGKQHAWHGNKDMDGGVLFTQFAHYIDIMYWLLGDIQIESAHLRNIAHADTIEFPDSGSVHFELPSGGMGSLSFTTAVWNRNYSSSITIIAEKGTITIGGQYMSDLLYCDVEGMEVPPSFPEVTPNDYGGYQGSAANHAWIYQNVVDVLQGRGHITTNALEGMKVVKLIETIHKKAGIT